MTQSDPPLVRNPGRRWIGIVLIVIVLLVALIVAIGASLTSALYGLDEDRLDEIETGFSATRTSFEAASDRVAGLVADNPGAQRIGWSLALVCVTDPVGNEQCADTSVDQRASFEQLSGANRVVWQAKDGGRMFFVFDVENPPTKYLTYDPHGRNARAYAEAQGFQWGREIDDRWSLLGHISDVDKQSPMWED